MGCRTPQVTVGAGETEMRAPGGSRGFRAPRRAAEMIGNANATVTAGYTAPVGPEPGGRRTRRQGSELARHVSGEHGAVTPIRVLREA
jgi:hypothetical protein